MTPEEIANSPLTKLQEENARLLEERDNYKAVALKRLGKLPGDAEFLDKDGNGEMSVAEQVRIALLDREIAKNQEAKEAENQRLIRENSELRLAIKNRPGSSGIGGDSGSSAAVKDNTFSEAQIAAMTARANRLKIDPTTYINNAKNNLNNRG
jgi:hypothetical protein